ncbi:MAG: efflux RND transporter periplasmic adaptor subunit, partial [Pseudomonadota bacterium]
MNFKLFFTNATVVAVLLLAGCDKGGSTASEEAAQQNQAEERDFNSITARPEILDRLQIGQPFLIDLA